MALRKNRFEIVDWRRLLRHDSYTLLVGLIVALVFFCTLPTSAQQTDSTASQQGRQLSLKQQLTLGLKAVTPRDKAFIDKVVEMVEQGKLPRSLVDSTFLWARQRADARSYARSLRPMVYFQPGLLARTKKLGIEL